MGFDGVLLIMREGKLQRPLSQLVIVTVCESRRFPPAMVVSIPDLSSTSKCGSVSIEKEERSCPLLMVASIFINSCSPNKILCLLNDNFTSCAGR
jgi:hypothetical protein